MLTGVGMCYLGVEGGGYWGGNYFGRYNSFGEGNSVVVGENCPAFGYSASRCSMGDHPIGGCYETGSVGVVDC